MNNKEKEELHKMLSMVFTNESIYYMYLDEVFVTPVELSNILSASKETSLIVLVEGDRDVKAVYSLAKWIKDNTELKVCWYSGEYLRKDFPKEYFDYLKTGPYIKDLGGLDSITTNQRFYEIRSKEIKNVKGEIIDSYRYLEDITHKFQRNARNNKNELG